MNKKTAMKPATTYAAIVGTVVAHYRGRRDVTQAECADVAMNLAPSTWSRIERGTSAFTVEQLARFAAWIGMAPNAIVMRADRAQAAMEARGIHVALERLSAEEITKRGLAIVAPGVIEELVRGKP